MSEGKKALSWEPFKKYIVTAMHLLPVGALKFIELKIWIKSCRRMFVLRKIHEGEVAGKNMIGEMWWIFRLSAVFSCKQFYRS